MDSMVDVGRGVFQIGIRLMDKNAIAEPGVVWKRVETIFTEFCRASGGPFVRADAQWMEGPVDPASLKPHELLVYLVRNSSVSLIQRHYLREFNQDPPGPDTIGLTAPNQAGGNLSEVYYTHPLLKDEPELIADTIVHELMHNKLNMGREMHSLAGPAGGFLEDRARTLSNLARRRGEKVEATGTDIRTMAPTLPRSVKQKAGI